MYLRLSPYREVLQGIFTNLQVSEGIIKLTGKSGAGKTALCSQLFHELENSHQPALFFLKPPSSATDLQNNILDNLHLDPNGNFTRTLTAYLLAKTTKPLVLIFDDAQQLDQKTFGAIRMLCNIQNESHSLVRVILCGTEELDAKLATPTLRAVTQFLSQSITLPYLTQEQVNDFCQGYWTLMGEDMKPLGDRALQRLFQETQGHPGILQARLNQGTTGAEKLEHHKEDEVPAPYVKPGRYAGRRAGWIPALLIILGLVVLSGAGAYLFFIPSVTPDTVALVSRPADLLPAPVVSEAPVATVTQAAANVVVAEVPPADTSEAEATDTLVVEAADSTEVPEVIEAAAEATADALPQEPVVATPAPAETVIIEIEPAPRLTIDAFIADWAQSWQNRDIDAYLAHYHADFMPAQGVTQDAWREQRRRAIGNAGEIMLSVEPLESTVEAGANRVVRFWLDYSAANYADRTLKELLLMPVDDNWRILSENNLRTERE